MVHTIADQCYCCLLIIGLHFSTIYLQNVVVDLQRRFSRWASLD